MGSFVIASCVLLHLLQFGSSADGFNKSVDESEYVQMLYKAGRFEEYSEILQIGDVNLVKPRKDSNSSDPMFHKNIEKGDILLRPWQKEEARQGINFERKPYRKWPNYIPYVINPIGYTPSSLLAIVRAIKAWNKNFDMIPFRMKRTRDKNYVTIFNGDGCYSHVGMVTGKQAISLQTGLCTNKEGTMHHEMMHAAGMTHEHERPDRDDYIRILWDNISSDWQPQYKKDSFDDYTILGPYDYYSVMHYGIIAPTTKLPAFDILEKNIDKSKVGQRRKQTEIDKQKIKKLYSKA